MHPQTAKTPKNTVPPGTLPLHAHRDLGRCRDDSTDRWPAEAASGVFTRGGFPSEETDRQLLAAMAAGSRVALERLHLCYLPRLAQFFTHLTAVSATETIDDLIADTLFEVWCSSATFTKQTSVYLSIMRLAYDRGRRRLAQAEPSQPDLDSLNERPARERWPANRSEAIPDLPDVFATLRVAERAVAYLVFSGHSRQEVLDILGMSQEAVDEHLASSLILLHPRLAWNSAPSGHSTDPSPLTPAIDEADEERT
jgi:DNA-directed RNA polymerase specialized sigma24 family protein